MTLPFRVVYADGYGTDPTGVADSTAAITAAYHAATNDGADPGRVVLGAGAYKIGSTADLPQFIRGQGLVAPGSGACVLNYVGNGIALSIRDSSWSSADSICGQFSGFRINGSGAGASAIGLSYGDMLLGRVDDVHVDNFAGTNGIGFYFKNSPGQWSEENVFSRCRAVTNTNNVVFDGGETGDVNGTSFDYSIYDFLIIGTQNQNGLVLQNGPQLVGCELHIRGNFNNTSGGANTGIAIAVEPNGANANGLSRVIHCSVDIAVEAGGSGTAHTCFKMAGGVGCQWQTVGDMVFADGGLTFVTASIGYNTNFAHVGVIHDGGAIFGTMEYGDAFRVYGGAGWREAGMGSTINPVNGSVLHKTLASGANTLTSTNTESFARILDIFLQQPASGSAGTVTWPATVFWPGGVTPTLSTANNAVDHIRLIYRPSTGNWYGELVGSAYAA
ncbi:MAG: hypothetical protein ACRDRL_00260 [Sciscionella sp.]